MRKDKKNWLVPALLFAAVFTSEWLLRRHIFIQKEYFGLFIDTPDYWNEIWSGPQALTTLAGDFISQFLRFPWAGPAIVALIATLCHLLLRRLFRLPGTVLAAVIFTAWFIPALLPSSRERERWAKVEYYSLRMQWDKVTKAIPPEAAEKDRVLIPYALLAWSEIGKLPENLFRYPVSGPQDLDLEGEHTRHGYYFTSLVNECMGCTNEAIHNTFQTACTTTHGICFGTLRQLIKYNIASGNKEMVRKYCDILEKSPLNAGTARAARKYAEALPDRSSLQNGGADTAATVTHSTYHNLRLMAKEGYFNDAAADRYRCLLLLQRDLRNFASSFQPEEDISSLPLCYQQALCLVSDPDIQRQLSPSVTAAFAKYMEAYNQLRTKEDGPIQPGTFWEYYFAGY